MSLLQDLFITIVNMSITASYVAIGVIFVRLLLKKAPKVFSYILWIPVLFRLVCPFSFGSAFSFFNLINLNAKQGIGVSEFIPQNIGLMHTPEIQSGIGSIDSAANASLPQAIPAASVNPTQIWIDVFSIIWIFGIIALLIYSIVSYVKIKGKLQTATRLNGNVFETDAIGTAFVCGFIRPKIYVPANIEDATLSYILEHERTHIRRKDYLIKPLAFLALILHWFNPLMWLCFALMSRDMEMSCDESVLHKLGDSAKGGYSNSLLSLSVKRKGLLAANPLAFGENHVKTRIKNILNYKKPAFWVIIIVVVAVCAAVIAFVANPSESATYISEDYKISLKYPSHWESNPNYIERYEGKDGFFQVGAINGESLSIDEVTKNDAFHKLNPYGSDPKIINRTIDGQEARLILPSADQPEEMRNQAGLIVKYPKAIKINGSLYYYFILWADEAHIEQIGNTLTFLKKQSGNAIDIRWDLPAYVPQLLKDYAPVRDYAEDYVREQIKYYNSLGYNITDAKITAMTLVNTGTASLTKAVEMWRLEYRLLPDDAGKVVLAGGMKMEDGWLTEWGSAGQPLLVTVRDWDSKSEIWRRVGVFNTARVQEEYHGDYTAAAMALYHDFISKTGITWEYIPTRSSVFPALPIRINMSFSNAHVSVDRGTLWLNGETKTFNYIDCGKEADYTADKTVFWSPLESDALNSGDIATGCILRFEITADGGSIHKGTILVDQSKNTENGVRFYSVALAEINADLVLAESGEDGGGCILKLPDE
ncbi:MAG: peptidase M56 [Eubacteriales bacterium]|jgi:beta-lactamase regulating signal transducer with metallopeptidase domain|nr:peptidase M56 [Eubacteriales bacterium]